MRYPVFLEPGNDDGLLLDASAAKGANFTVLTKNELDNLNTLALIAGVTVYVTEEQVTYRWNGTEWNEVTATDAYSKAEIDNKISKLENKIKESAATYRGTFNTLDELKANENANENDYAFVKDSTTNNYWKYVFSEGKWEPQFETNLSLSSEQWDSLNSGLNRTSFQYWNISYTEKDGGDN